MAVAGGGREKAARGAVLGGETLDQIGADLVIGLPDHRPDGGADVAARGAEPFHGGDGRLDDARQRAAPAGMRGADHMGFRIGEQDRAAIGRGHADGKRAHAGDDGVGARPRVGRPRSFGDNDLGRMHLIEGEEAVRLDAERRRHARAVFRDMAGVVLRAGAAIEARIDAAGHAAGAGEEGMANAGQSQATAREAS